MNFTRENSYDGCSSEHPFLLSWCFIAPHKHCNLSCHATAAALEYNSNMPMMTRAAARTIRKSFLIFWAIVILGGILSRAQLNNDASKKDANAVQAGGAEDIISFLNQTIVWSRQLTAEQQLVSEPSDALFLNDSRQVADQVVKLAFDFARARAQAMASQTDSAASRSQAPSQYQRLIDSATKADQQVKGLQAGTG